ncbi:MAG: TetR/AcrR family transcriptional regulator [Bacteroides sp.]|nr:TetR/AcrR family transcriptional regulator [Bacteroides sp.]
MKKIEKKDWFTEGLKVLATEGFAKITIDNLCSILKVTKGSFYHHFGNVDGYIESLMKYWLEENTLSFIERSNKINDADKRKRILYEMAIMSSIKEEQAIRAWGYSNKIVSSYVQRVDEMRLNYVAQIEKKTGFNNNEARNSALMLYSLLLGIQQLSASIREDEYKEIFNMIIKLSNRHESV